MDVLALDERAEEVQPSAAAARYRCRPPCRHTSRLTVEGARRRWRLICRSDALQARPREMASGSVSVSARRARCRAGGGIPPVRATSYRTTWAIRPSARPMAFRDPAPAAPQFRLLSQRQARAMSSHHETSILASCCIDPLNAPPKSGLL